MAAIFKFFNATFDKRSNVSVTVRKLMAFERKVKEDAIPLHIIKANVARILETETTETAAINNEPEKGCISKCIRIITNDASI